jgi:hypothetical protein
MAQLDRFGDGAMGKIKEQNFQLKLALQDEDLKTPTHDEILFWVEEWARNVENIRPFLKIAPQRREYTVVELDQTSLDSIKGASEIHSIEISIKSENEKLHFKPAKAPWEGEPPCQLVYKFGKWEPQLNVVDQNGNSRMVGFLDYAARYEFTCQVNRTTRVIKRVVFDEDLKPVMGTSYRPPRKWHLEEVETRVEFSVEMDYRRIYFEIKSAIKSVGDLMRQLTYYRNSHEIKVVEERNGIGIIVVAPENDKATRVIREQGYAFVAYTPYSMKQT